LLRRTLVIGLLAAAAAFTACGAADAHPHVWVDAKAEVVFNKAGEITAIRHIWQFDPDFTAYATLNLDANNDGKLTEDELKPLADTNVQSLAAYDYFTYLYVGTKKVAFSKPTEYWLDFHNKRLTLFYTLPLKTPLALHGSAMIEVGDPEYFVAISFPKGQEVSLDSAPVGCAASFKPPHDLDAQTMAILSAVPIDQHDLPPNLVQAASLLMNVITLKCPGGDNSDAGDAAAAAAVEATGGATADQSGTLSAADKAIDAPSAAASSAPAAASASKQVTVIPISEPPPSPPTNPPPSQSSGGFFGWLGGLWQNAVK